MTWRTPNLKTCPKTRQVNGWPVGETIQGAIRGQAPILKITCHGQRVIGACPPIHPVSPYSSREKAYQVILHEKQESVDSI